MRQFKECFETYGGDYDLTMDRFMGDEAMYLRFLDMLPQDDNLSKLGAALDGGDYTGAFEAAHTLKGVTGNMGLTPLYQAVCAMVEPLRQGRQGDYGALYQAICSEFQRVETLRENLKGVG